jgi:hypothetical protein
MSVVIGKGMTEGFVKKRHAAQIACWKIWMNAKSLEPGSFFCFANPHIVTEDQLACVVLTIQEKRNTILKKVSENWNRDTLRQRRDSLVSFFPDV